MPVIAIYAAVHSTKPVLHTVGHDIYDHTLNPTYAITIQENCPELREFFKGIQELAYKLGLEDLGDQIDLAGLVDDITELPDEAHEE